jgi:subtilisin family serine protease
MATPHTTGAAALYLQGDTGATPAAVRAYLFGRLALITVISAKTADNGLLQTIRLPLP